MLCNSGFMDDVTFGRSIGRMAMRAASGVASRVSGIKRSVVCFSKLLSVTTYQRGEILF